MFTHKGESWVKKNKKDEKGCEFKNKKRKDLKRKVFCWFIYCMFCMNPFQRIGIKYEASYFYPLCERENKNNLHQTIDKAAVISK